MAAVYSRRLAGGVLPIGAAHQLVLCPLGLRFIVRDIVLLQTAAAATLVNLYITTGSGDIHLYRKSLESLVTDHLELRQAMNEGDVLSLFAQGTGGDVSFGVTGYEFVV